MMTCPTTYSCLRTKPLSDRAEAVVPEGAILMGSISIVHYMIEDDFQVAISSQDSSGEQMRIVTLLGLLETAKAFVTHDYLERTNNDD